MRSWSLNPVCATAVESTKSWIRSFVVPLKLCPFAARAEARVVAQTDTDLFIQLALADSKRQCEMDGDADPPFRSTFVVLDSKLDFGHFMHIAGKTQQLAFSQNLLHPNDPTMVAMVGTENTEPVAGGV